MMTIELAKTQIEEISDLGEKIGELEDLINEIDATEYKDKDAFYLRNEKHGTFALEVKTIRLALLAQQHEYVARMRRYGIVWRSGIKTVDAGSE